MKNKVIEIQNLVAAGNWMHISTKENKAADLLSKGCKRVELEKIGTSYIIQTPEKP